MQADAVLLALGGASWSKLGSDGKWVEPLTAAGVPVADLRPNNVGFEVFFEMPPEMRGEEPQESGDLRFDAARAPA